MPIRRGEDKEGAYYQWGKRGPKVHYTPGDEKSRKKAKEKIHKIVGAIKSKKK